MTGTIPGKKIFVVYFDFLFGSVPIRIYNLYCSWQPGVNTVFSASLSGSSHVVHLYLPSPFQYRSIRSALSRDTAEA